MKQTYDLIIIGGGPGGIASVVEASAFKVSSILLIEKGENHSQTIRQYYKDSKRVDRDWKGQEIELQGTMKFYDGTKETTLSYFEELLDSSAFDCQTHTTVTAVKKVDDVFEVISTAGTFTASTVIVAIGRMGKPNKPSYPIAPSIRGMVSHSPYECQGNQKILVVGGGDSAVEYACQLSTINTVTLSYRKESFSRINGINQEMIARYDNEERLRVRFDTDIESIGLCEDKIRIKVLYIGGFEVTYDRILFALGGTTPVDFLREAGVDLAEDFTPILSEHNETSVQGLYLVGDITQKRGGSIALAINNAFDALSSIAQASTPKEEA